MCVKPFKQQFSNDPKFQARLIWLVKALIVFRVGVARIKIWSNLSYKTLHEIPKSYLDGINTVASFTIHLLCIQSNSVKPNKGRRFALHNRENKTMGVLHLKFSLMILGLVSKTALI